MESGTRVEGAVVGTVVGISAAGDPLVDYPGNPGGAVVARSALKSGPGALSREVVLVFESGDPSRPVILGILHPPGAPASGAVEVESDGKTIHLTAEREIVLRCGKASITLTREGKVLLQGSYVSSRSSGANRIKGGTVHIN